jgi:hypothetical protein
VFLEVWISFRLLAAGAEGTVLEETFLSALRPRAAAVCQEWKAKKADGVSLVWGAKPSAETMRKLDSNSEGKQFYVLWLKDRYSYNIARLNEAYGLEAAAFTDLVESDFRTLDRSRSAVKKDDADFYQVLEETLTQKTAVLLETCAPGLKLRWDPAQ